MAELGDKMYKKFVSTYRKEPIMVESPGSINLLGDHTDYNDGFVLSTAIDRVIVMGMAKNNLERIRAFSVDMNESTVMDLNDLCKNEKHWANYIKGVAVELQRAGFDIKGFDIVFGGNIPIGAGLSSSAALEGGLLVGLNHLFKLGLTRIKKTGIGQLAEQNHIGVNGGIMDQFINLHGEKDKALKLDCRTLEYQQYPFKQDDINLVVCNSKVNHNVATSECNVRREQCKKGMKVLQKYNPEIKNLRDVSFEQLEEHKNEMNELAYLRCKFVLEENERVQRACSHLEEKDFEAFGKQMFVSHEGLSSHYEVSCEEVDILVELAKDHPGVLGSRMMGEGFGGCTVNLVKEEQVSSFKDFMAEEYRSRTGIEAGIYITQISDGAKIIEM